MEPIAGATRCKGRPGFWGPVRRRIFPAERGVQCPELLSSRPPGTPLGRADLEPRLPKGWGDPGAGWGREERRRGSPAKGGWVPTERRGWGSYRIQGQPTENLHAGTVGMEPSDGAGAPGLFPSDAAPALSPPTSAPGRRQMTPRRPAKGRPQQGGSLRLRPLQARGRDEKRAGCTFPTGNFLPVWPPPGAAAGRPASGSRSLPELQGLSERPAKGPTATPGPSESAGGGRVGSVTAWLGGSGRGAMRGRSPRLQAHLGGF